MTDELRRLLVEATPGPWERVTEGNYDQRHAAAQAFLSVMATKAKDDSDIQFSDLTYIRAGFPNVAMVGNGPKQTENGDLIVAAVNALPDLLAVVDAARVVVGEPANGSGFTAARARLADAFARLDGAR